MNELKIKCPTCGKILRLANIANIEKLSFSCPICKEKHVVGKCEHIKEQPQYNDLLNERTQYSNDSSENTEQTQVFQDSKVSLGHFVDQANNIYPLALGINTIGRKAETSDASIQIITVDRSMSRSHSVVEVMQKGKELIHVFSHGKGKNNSFYNGIVIHAVDKIVLKNNDKVTMGVTELTFKC